jgi:CO/xanthine dehydrogenase FAD-binding subunit
MERELSARSGGVQSSPAVKPPPFAYDAPESVDEALALLAEHGDDAKVLAGGQSLIPLLALRLARPARLVDVGRIAELQALTLDGGVRIGAGVRQRTAERSRDLAAANPLVGQAIPFIGHVPIRSRGTVGGSVAHADPAAELPAVMLLLEATMVARRAAGGTREIAAADFFEGFFTTALAAEDLLVEIRLPPWPAGAGTAFQEVARRHGDFALVGAGAVVVRDAGGTVTDARLAFTGVAGTPVRSAAAEAVLRGSRADAEAIAAAAAAVGGDIDPAGDVHATAAYRRHVAGVLARRVLTEAVA